MKENKINSEPEYESFSLKNFVLLCLGYWKWFLLSIVLAVGMGLLYIYRSQPLYERSEEILVKDQENGSGVGEMSNSFSQLGLFANQTKVYNELIAFTSPAVIREVVKRLDLTMNYDLRKGLKRQTLYGTNLPVIVDFPDLPSDVNVGFKMSLQPDGRFTIKKIRKSVQGTQEKYSDLVSGKVDGPSVMSPVGRITVRTNDIYVPFEEDEIKNIDVFRQGLQGTVEKYVAKLKGDLTDPDADVINLSINDNSIERADDILNTVVTVYNERWIDDKNKVAVATSNFISDRLKVIEQELGQVDDNIAGHKSRMRIPDLEAAATGFMEQEMAINRELLQATNYLAMTKFLKEYMQDPKNTYSILPMNTGTENMILEEQIGAYNELLLQRNNLAENSSDQNPLVKDQNKALAGMRASIMRSVDSQIANLESVIRNIDRAQASNREMLSTSPLQAKSLLSEERQQLVMEQLYLFLLQKREETELTQKFTADNIRLITPPYGKQKPIAPKKALLILISFFIGLGVPAGILFLVESTNTKIRSKKDMENLPVPFAGEIPHIGKDKRWIKLFQTKDKKRKDIDKPKVIVSEGKRDIPNEAFRVVRSNIDFMLAKNEKIAIALTSFNPGSGKSFIAFNLGASFALKGKKVLVIDGDLRHGSISTYVNSPRKGLSTYLTGNVSDWRSMVIQSSEFADLYVLPIGHRPPNPAELLDNGRLGTLIEEAKQEFDIVLIDCPPVNIVVDTQIINQYVGRTLFVIRAGLLEKKALRDLEALVDEKKLKNITVLLNGTKTEFSSYHTYGNYEAIDKG